MKKKVLYFGYGANRDAEMMRAIVGRIPEGFPGMVTGFKLCVQTWREIPDSVKKELKPPWDEKFVTYCLKISNNQADQVRGIIWQLDSLERKLIDNWEITGKWYNVHTINFTDLEGVPVTLEIQIMNYLAQKKVSGKRYKTFLNSPAKMLRVACDCRQDYLARYYV